MNRREKIFESMKSTFTVLGDRMDQMNWEDPRLYIQWLAQTHYHVRQVTPLVALACAHTPTSRSGLHYRFIEELSEEKGHEKLLERDLDFFGFKPREFEELPPAAIFYQTLHYLVSQTTPVSILSYSLTLEGLAAKRLAPIYQRVKLAHGDKAANFLRLHCEVDIGHFDAALPALDMCEDHELDIIEKGLKQCSYIYMGLLNMVEEVAANDLKILEVSEAQGNHPTTKSTDLMGQA